MGTNCGGCGVNIFTTLDPTRQAQHLAMLAQEARLLEFSLVTEDPATQGIGNRLQRALEQAMDADGADEAHRAQQELEAVLLGVRNAGMQLSAEVGEMDIDGVLGTMKMRVLSTVLSPPKQALQG